jgi:iron complex transport system substrate-binding protein|tara:strand:+ start:173 stop:1069 length:897 start_codon:yes stop_codon:yes gene_type:complete
MKIVSLLPSASEILVGLDLLDNIVGISHECNYPSSLNDIPKITYSDIPKSTNQKKIDDLVTSSVNNNVPLYHIDNNKLNAVAPDIIITQGVCDVCAISEGQIEATLRNVKCNISDKTKIISMNGGTFNEICDEILNLGSDLGKVNKAEDIVNSAREKYAELLNSKKSKKSILLLEWLDPYFSAGHWIPEQIELAGFKSAIGAIGERSKKITADMITAINPDYIGVVCCGFNFEENKNFANNLYSDEKINFLDAFQKKNIFAFDADSYFSRPTLRIIEGARQLKDAICDEDSRFRCHGL